jgi:phenylpropionate dioxygenase-like ring-hydroxylating dioxygenase large terminal subunit
VPAKAPATAFRCTERYGFVWVALEEPRWALPEVPELEDVIFEQDRAVVESQRPERVPFDLADELHLTRGRGRGRVSAGNARKRARP